MNACVDNIRTSLDAGLFGKDGRGHAFKLDAYRENIMQVDANADIQLGFLIELHTDLRQWFLNDALKETRVSPGQFPISCEAYELSQESIDSR